MALPRKPESPFCDMLLVKKSLGVILGKNRGAVLSGG
jgi:hypothetical protein